MIPVGVYTKNDSDSTHQEKKTPSCHTEQNLKIIGRRLYGKCEIKNILQKKLLNVHQKNMYVSPKTCDEFGGGANLIITQRL